MSEAKAPENSKVKAILSRRLHVLRGSIAHSALLRAAPVALVALSLAGEAHAQAINWTGGDGNWSNPGKWSTGAVPDGTVVDPAIPSPAVIGTGAVGTVTIDSNSVARNIQVGGGSTLQIISGGVLDTTPANNANSINTVGLGSIGTGTGTMLIDGAGSAWNAGIAGVRVGNGATGTLTVSNGGKLDMTDGLLSVGLNAGGSGTLTIDGGNVTNQVAALRLGYNGAAGTLNILNGGKLKTSNLNTVGLTDAAGAGTGTVTISGPNSNWTITAGTPGSDGNLEVGKGTGANGKITVSNGASMEVAVSAIIGMQGGTGSLTVSGAGSHWDIVSKGLNLGQGSGSSGTVTLSNGGNITVNQSVSVGYTGGTGTMSVDGQGSTFTGNEDFSVGDATNTNNTLTVSNGGTVKIKNAIIIGQSGGTGTATVDGQGSLLTSTNGYLNVGNVANSTGTLNIANGGTVSVTAGTTNIGLGAGATGTVNVSSGGKFNVANAALGFGAGATGTLNLTGGGQFSSTAGLEIGWDTGTGVASVTGQGTSLAAAGNIFIGHDLGNGGTAGTLTVADGGVVKAGMLFVGFTAGGKGILNIGAGAGAGLLEANVVMGGTSSAINFNHNQANYSFASTISDGTGANAPVNSSVNFIGTGTTILTGVNTYSGATNINNGQLQIASGASIANSSLTTVNTGATLSGAGSAGNVLVAGGGTIAPTGFGTLAVKHITFAAGSTYQVGINAAGQGGSIAATTATLQGGTVKVNAGTGNYAPNTRYTILSSTGGVTGQFAGLVVSDFAFLTTALDYADPNRVDLAVARNSKSFASVAVTENQRSTAGGVAGLPASNKLYAAVVQQNDAGAQTAFDALSGEAHAGNQAALIGNSLVVGDTISNRLSQSFYDSASFGASAAGANSFAAEDSDALNYAGSEKKLGTVGARWPITRKAPVMAPPPVVYASWAQGFGSWLNRNSDGNAATLKSETGGVLSGIDVTYLGMYRFGLAGGYGRTDTSVGARSSSLQADGYHIAAYGGARQGAVGLQTGVIYSWNDISSTRTIAFPGFLETVKADYNATSMQVFGEANYRFIAGSTAIEPFAGVNYINLHTGAFSESGGASALTMADSERDVTFSTLGLRSSALLGQGYGGSFTGRGTLGWRHAFGDTDTKVLASFAGSSPFTVTGTPIATDALLAEAGLDVEIRPQMTAGISWSGQFGEKTVENRLKGQFIYRW